MIANHKGEIPFVVFLLPFLAGIVYGYNFHVNVFLLLTALALACTAFIGLNLAYTLLKLYKHSWLGGILTTFILLVLGWLVTINHYDLDKPDHFSRMPAQYLDAVITSEPKAKDGLVRFTAEIKTSFNNNKPTATTGLLLVTIKDDLALNLFYGEELLIPANCKPVDPPFNPAEFNYKKYLAHKNIYHQAFLYPKQYRVVKAGQGNALVGHALQLRQNLVKKLALNMRDTNAIAVASTLILGYKADLSNDILQAYSKTGTIHILSVSGGHVAIIYLLLNWALGFLSTYSYGKIVKAVAIITLIWAYALLTGFSPAVCRAALIISMVITGKTYSRYINSLNLLAASAFALLLYDPFLLTDVGFQLSYLSVAGLIIFQPVIYKWFTFKHAFADKLWLIISVSIAAQAVTFPLSACYFHQFPVYFLLSNLLIIIPVSSIMYSGLLLLMLPQMPFVSGALAFILEKCIQLMNNGLTFIEHSPYASLDKIWISPYECLLLYLIIIFCFYFTCSRKAWQLKAALVSILLFTLCIGFDKIKADCTSSITFLNLRKNTGIIFKNGADGVVLTNLADSSKNFQYSVQPCLDSMRIRNYKVLNLSENISTPYLVKNGALVQFNNKKILLLNNNDQIKSIPLNLNINYLYLSGNPYINISITKGQNLIINSDNTDAYISRLLLSVKNTSTNYRVLKRNKSFTLISNTCN